MTHTKGPWVVDDCEFVVHAKNKSICALYQHKDKKFKANARLIAAAPELLEACKLAEKFIGELNPEKEDYSFIDLGNTLTSLKQAIARAEEIK